MKEVRAQARLTAELASIQMDHPCWFVVEKPTESTMWRTRVLCRATTDGRTIMVSVVCAEASEQVKFASNSPHVAEKIRECSRGDASYEGLRKQMKQLKIDGGVSR